MRNPNSHNAHTMRKCSSTISNIHFKFHFGSINSKSDSSCEESRDIDYHVWEIIINRAVTIPELKYFRSLKHWIGVSIQVTS